MSKDVLDSSLVGRWLVNSSLLDMSGNGNHGTNHGTLPVINERGQGRKFDGVNDIDCGNDESLYIGENDFSLCAWVKLKYIDITAGYICRKREGTQWYSWRIKYSTKEIYLETKASGGTSFNATRLNWNIWTFIAVTKIGTIARHYTNGIKSGSGVANDDVGNAGDFIIGSSKIGSIQDLRIYNRALSQEEITNIYEATKISKNIFPPIRNFKPECPLYLRETFAGHPVGETHPRGWNKGTGEFIIKEHTEANPLLGTRIGDRYMECTSNGTIVIQSKQAYGTWEFEVNQKIASYTSFYLISNSLDLTEQTFILSFRKYDRQIFFIKNGSILRQTVKNYLNIDSYRIKIIRTNLGVFTFYIKGGDFGKNYVPLIFGNNGNTVTDNTIKESNYILIYGSTNNQIGNIILTK